MKIYITARFKGTENKPEIEALCAAVKAAGMEDFCFVRDIENYQKTFDDPKELWESARHEIEQCQGLLIDVSDAPSGGRVVEAGIAYGLRLPIFVVAKRGVPYKGLYDGIAVKVIEYDTLADVAAGLLDYANN
ncbi:hypothetical protein JNJ66_00170 [Candidatus Saccharibacteria bacterium]|nr:hypothetical protein [Candidatus Saccharibacteria bacterium]